MARRRWVGVVLAGVGSLVGTLVATQSSTGCAEAAMAKEPLRIMPLGDSITQGGGPDHSYRGFLQQQLNAAGYSYDFVGSYGNIVPPGGEATWAWADETQSNYRGSLDRDFEGHGGFQAGQPEAVVGYKDHMLAQMVPTDIPLFQPDIVLLHIGTNDYLGGWTTHGPWHGPGGDWDQRVELSAKNVIDLIDTIHQLRPQTTILVSAIARPGLNTILDGLTQVSNIVKAGVQTRQSAGRNLRFVANTYDTITTADMADAVHPNDNGYTKMATTWYQALTPLLDNMGVGTPSAAVPAATAAVPASSADTAASPPETTGSVRPEGAGSGDGGTRGPNAADPTTVAASSGLPANAPTSAATAAAVAVPASSVPSAGQATSASSRATTTVSSPEPTGSAPAVSTPPAKASSGRCGAHATAVPVNRYPR